MSTRKRSISTKVVTQTLETSVAAPQVVAYRMARMALASPVLSNRDRKEFSGMIHEKQEAFAQAWIGATQQAFKAQQMLAASVWRSMLSGDLFNPMSSSTKLMNQVVHQSVSVASAAISPVHSKAVQNSKRLRKTPLLPARRKL